MLCFSYSTVIDAPVEKVWAFHERSDILKILTPPWQPVQVISHQGGLEVGSISEFRLWLGVFPIQWVAQHIECNKPYLFVDKQIIGPMEYWIHRHQFIPLCYAQKNQKQQTRLTDSIDYTIIGGFFTEFLLGWWVNSRLKEMFRYRHEITEQFCKDEAE